MTISVICTYVQDKENLNSYQVKFKVVDKGIGIAEVD